MKKVLAVAFVLAILSIGFSASAQVPYVQVYFDIGASEGSASCPAVAGMQELHVFAVNFNMWIAAIEYMIAVPASLTIIGDVAVPGALQIGNSSVGISWSFPIPGNGWAPYKTQGLNVWWNCTNCTGYEDGQIIVLPHPVSGQISAVSWPDLISVTAVGMTSTVCPVDVPAQESTWGSVKSLYK